MYYIKYMPFRSILNASRNKREISVAQEEGYDVIVFSNDKPSICVYTNDIIQRIYDGTTALTPDMSFLKKIIKLSGNYFSVAIKTITMPYGVWSCHDLSSLKIAWLLSRLRIKKPLLIYDSHEFELGRNKKRTEREKKSVYRWERFLMKKCIFSIMVNDSIADLVQNIYELEKRPIVLRSIPNNWIIDPEVCKKTRNEFLDYFVHLR